MEPFSTSSMLAIAGKLLTAEATKAAVAGIKNQLQPDKMATVLQKAIESAQAAQPATGGIFFRCQSKAAEGFLEQLFKSTEVVRELQKPLQDDGKPDVAVLLMAFDRSAQQYVGMQNYIPDTLHSWVEIFVDSYFEQLQGICFQVAKEQYLKQLAHRVDDVKFVGIAVPGEEVEKQEVLAQIFVMPDVREERNRISPSSYRLDLDLSDWISPDTKSYPLSRAQQSEIKLLRQSMRQDNLLKEQKEWAVRDRSAPRIPAQTVINNQKKAVVLGAPGSGKTMLASYFALMLCETEQSDPTQIGLKTEDDYLPVVVRIRDWILQPNMGLLEYLRSNAEASLACKELPSGFFEHWLERGKALILLDGLDEVVDEAQRRKVAEQIETFLHQYQDNPAVITSRPAGYRWDFFNLDEFPHYTLESFDDKQVATFIDHWYDSRLKDDPAQAERQKADLQKAFARNERIRLLARNPLLLTIIALIHRYQRELPRRRCNLYEKAVETLLTSWDNGKEIKLYSQVLLFLKSDDLLYILKKLAYWIHTQGSTGETEGGTLIDKDELIRQLRTVIQKITVCKTHEAKAEAERFVDFIQKRTGLLNEQGRDRYAFVHKTFQEYLTAEEIYEIDESGEDTEIIGKHFREHLHDQHWREVLLLLVSKLKGKKAQNAIQVVLEADSKYEQWLHRDLLFAGWCLTEDPSRLTTVAQDFVGVILDRLINLEVANSNLIGVRVSQEVNEVLHCFNGTTIRLDVWTRLEVQKNQIDHFRLLKFQSTLGNESEAINILISLLDNTSLNIRLNAVEALVDLGNSDSEVMNCLLSLLNNRKLNSFYRATRALVELGNTSLDVENSLLSLINNEELVVSTRAAIALGRLENTSSEIENSLLSFIGNNDFSMSTQAALALGRLKNTSPAVVNALLTLSKDERPVVRTRAALALGRLGNSNPEVINSLLSLLNDSNSDVVSHSATALGQLKNNSQEVINSLLFLLNNSNSSVVSHSATALGQLENNSQEVIDSLLSLLDDKKPHVRLSATVALVNLGNTSVDVIESLQVLLVDKKSSARLGASEALAQLAKTSDAIRPRVLQLLEQHLNDDEIGSAIDCLWSIVVE
jgi:HEAT repeat protein